MRLPLQASTQLRARRPVLLPLRRRRAVFAGGLVLSGVVVAGCAAVIGLDPLERVACVADCGGAEGGVDAQPPLDAGPDAPTFCQLQGAHQLCADFDEGDFTIGWSSSAQSTLPPTTLLDLDKQQFRSPPASLITAVSVDAGSPALAYVEKTFGSPAKSAHLAFDLRVSQATFAAGATGEIARIHFSTDDSGISLAWTSAGAVVIVSTDDDAGSLGSKTFPLAPAFPTGAWRRIVLDVTFSATTSGKFTLTVDDAPGAAQTGLVTANPTASSTTLDLGFTGVGATPNFSANVDNVTFDFQ